MRRRTRPLDPTELKAIKSTDVFDIVYVNQFDDYIQKWPESQLTKFLSSFNKSNKAKGSCSEDANNIISSNDNSSINSVKNISINNSNSSSINKNIPMPQIYQIYRPVNKDDSDNEDFNKDDNEKCAYDEKHAGEDALDKLFQPDIRLSSSLWVDASVLPFYSKNEVEKNGSTDDDGTNIQSTEKRDECGLGNDRKNDKIFPENEKEMKKYDINDGINNSCCCYFNNIDKEGNNDGNDKNAVGDLSPCELQDMVDGIFTLSDELLVDLCLNDNIKLYPYSKEMDEWENGISELEKLAFELSLKKLPNIDKTILERVKNNRNHYCCVNVDGNNSPKKINNSNAGRNNNEESSISFQKNANDEVVNKGDALLIDAIDKNIVYSSKKDISFFHNNVIKGGLKKDSIIIAQRKMMANYLLNKNIINSNNTGCKGRKNRIKRKLICYEDNNNIDENRTFQESRFTRTKQIKKSLLQTVNKHPRAYRSHKRHKFIKKKGPLRQGDNIEDSGSNGSNKNSQFKFPDNYYDDYNSLFTPLKLCSDEIPSLSSIVPRPKHINSKIYEKWLQWRANTSEPKRPWGLPLVSPAYFEPCITDDFFIPAHSAPSVTNFDFYDAFQSHKMFHHQHNLKKNHVEKREHEKNLKQNLEQEKKNENERKITDQHFQEMNLPQNLHITTEIEKFKESKTSYTEESGHKEGQAISGEKDLEIKQYQDSYDYSFDTTGRNNSKEDDKELSNEVVQLSSSSLPKSSLWFLPFKPSDNFIRSALSLPRFPMPQRQVEISNFDLQGIEGSSLGDNFNANYGFLPMTQAFADIPLEKRNESELNQKKLLKKKNMIKLYEEEEDLFILPECNVDFSLNNLCLFDEKNEEQKEEGDRVCKSDDK